MLQFIKCRWPWLKKKSQEQLTEAELQIYKLEKVTNFRWVARHFGKLSDVTLSSKDIVPSTLQTEISQIGQFAEVACGLYDTALVWRYLEDLSKPGYPLELHDVLQQAILVKVLQGRHSKVQAIIAYRKTERQLVFAFSGTFNVTQALHDINAFKTVYEPCRKLNADIVKVHAGFWRLYRGIRRRALEALASCIFTDSEDLEVKEIVVTGHSLGGGLAILLMMDLLNSKFCSKYLKGAELINQGTTLSIVVFGAPRVGNATFAELYRASVAGFRERYGNAAYREYSIKAYNDGVPALPAVSLGYCHAISSVLFLHRGKLYVTPPSEHECSNFNVTHDEVECGSSPLPYSLGGHNYYNGRDLEKLARRMNWFAKSRAKRIDEGWQERYLAEVEKERKKLENMAQKQQGGK